MWEKLNNYAEKRELIKIVSEKTGIPAGYVFIGFITLLLILLLRGFGGLITTLFLCFMYPAYLTYKALKHNHSEMLPRLSKYWVVLSFGVFVYQVIEWFLSDLPFLGIIKFICAFMLIRSQGSGAVYLYDNMVAPLIAKYEEFIDNNITYIEGAVEKGQESLSGMSSKVAGAAMGAMAGNFAKDKSS